MNTISYVFERLHKFFAVPLLMALGMGAASATSIRGLCFDQITANSELIIEARVLRSESEWDADKRNISTIVTFDVIQTLAGELSSSEVVLSFFGGSKDGITQRVQGLEYPKVGEHGIYFVESTSEKMINPLLGWSQGHYKVIGGRMFAARGQPVTGMSGCNRMPLGQVSQGVAGGVLTNRISEDGIGLDVKEFKRMISDSLEKDSLDDS